MKANELKAVVMAILSPRGAMMQLNKQNFDYMEKNADEIMKRCGLGEEKPNQPQEL